MPRVHPHLSRVQPLDECLIRLPSVLADVQLFQFNIPLRLGETKVESCVNKGFEDEPGI